MPKIVNLNIHMKKLKEFNFEVLHSSLHYTWWPGLSAAPPSKPNRTAFTSLVVLIPASM